MDHGLYGAYAGLRARQRALDVMANNIANAATPGFKGDQLLFHSLQADASASIQNSNIKKSFNTDGSLASAHAEAISVVASSVSDYSAGSIRDTGRDLDLALNGDGFFVVQTSSGEKFTRAGSFVRDISGQLTTHQGDLVIGENGPITLSTGKIVIGNDGTIAMDGQVVNKLKIVRFDNPRTALLKEGSLLFTLIDKTQNPLPSTSTRVIQGSLESSNIEGITEMAAMLENTRQFESLQRSLTTLANDVGRKVANELGRI